MGNEEFTTEDNFKSIQQSINKHGRLKTFFDQIQAWLPRIFILLVFLGFQFNTNNRLQKIERQLNLNVNSTTNIINNDLWSNQAQSEKDESTLKIEKPPEVQGNTNLFDPEDWIIKGFEKDSEGFYCPIMKGYNYWSIWSKKKIPATFSIKLRLKVKSKTNKPPSTTLSYGEYIENYSPKIYYRLTFFDSSEISIRLYNENNKGVEQDWLKEKPNFNHEMIIVLSPRVPDPKDRKININPSLIYNSSKSGSRIEFRSKKEFMTNLPAVELEESSFQNQLGIGIELGSCIKLLAIEL